MTLAITVSRYSDVDKRAVDLDCNVPTGIALLPRNFETAKSKEDLIHEDSAPTVRTLWRQAGIAETRLESEEDRFSYIHENAADWVGPTIFVSASLLGGNPSAIAIALGVVSNYLTELFRGSPRNEVVRLTIVKEKLATGTNERSYLQVCYEGNVNGSIDLPSIIREVHSDA